MESSTSSLQKKNLKETIVSVNFKSFDKRFICLRRWNQEKILDNEIMYCDSCNFMATTDCGLSKMPIEFVAQDSETQELLDLKSIFDVFENDFSEVIQNSKEKIALAKSILKKKIKLQYVASNMRLLEILPNEN